MEWQSMMGQSTSNLTYQAWRHDLEVSPFQFEAHAGWASRRKLYLHIYTSNGVSLYELSLKLSQLRKLFAEENDDLFAKFCNSVTPSLLVVLSMNRLFITSTSGTIWIQKILLTAPRMEFTQKVVD